MLITHSLGEVDALLPLFLAISRKQRVKIEMVFTVRSIYHQFLGNTFYRVFAERFHIRVTCCQLPNKFDFRNSSLYGYRVGRAIIYRIYFPLARLYAIPRLFPKLAFSQIFMHECTNQQGSTSFLYLFNSHFSKKIFTYMHGQSFNQPPVIPRRIPQASRSTFLLWHPNNRALAESWGFQNFHLIGMTKFWPEWAEYINSYQTATPLSSGHVVIYTREANNEVYMSKKIYKNLLVTAYSIIRRKLANTPIIIKPHPRENLAFLKALIRDHGLEGVGISHEHSAVLAKDALFCVSFWTSCVFDSLALSVPTVEYFIEPKDFRLAEPAGSMYKLFGIASVETANDFDEFIDSVIQGRFRMPAIVRQLRVTKSLDFLVDQ